MKRLLALNAGSSSIRFVVFEVIEQPRPVLAGKLERLGLPGTVLNVRTPERQQIVLPASTYDDALTFLLDWLETHTQLSAVNAVGHRVVHGLAHSSPEVVTDALLDELRALGRWNPEHLPHQLALIDVLRKRLPTVPQVACFDTAFHRTMPAVASRLPLPRRFAAKGLQRYGFHGLSYAYLVQQLEALGDRGRRVVLAHLGNGASLAAVLDGTCVDTSMGFTPGSGLVMSTRAGDLDPSVVCYLAETEGLRGEQLLALLTHQSGMLGLSETSGDVRDLLGREATDVRAAEALETFCYQARKWLGSFAAVLGGVDTLVFAGGIGENAAVLRARICEPLAFLGVHLDARRNEQNAPVISTDASAVVVRVIATDEESMIAQLTLQATGPA
jgi:acetate kinase